MKAWHIVREPHFQYFLVDVISPKENTNKVHIKYQGERYLVNKQQLLPYASNRPKNISQIQQNNQVEIMDFLNNQFDGMNYWVKINKKLVIDFNNNTELQRQKFIKFILGRFLVTEKRRQYLCVSNHKSMCNKSGVIIKTIFQVVKNINHLWKYRISLDDLSQVYAIFFRDIPMKMKIYIKNSQIIKLSMIPYNLFSLNLLGTIGTNNLIDLKVRIFNAMANSNRQIKNYYRVPYSSSSNQIQNENLESITNYLMHIGLTINEIKSIIEIYSLILNINYLQLVKSRKQDKHPFKIRQGSAIRNNLSYLIGEQLIQMLQKELNTYQEGIECNKKNIELKQKLLMLIIYQQITLKVSEMLNEKMCNVSESLQNYQEFILIEFPPIHKEQQKTAQHYYMELANKKIESMGLDIPLKKETYSFKLDAVNQKIRQQYQYDINKQILRQMGKSTRWLNNLKNCQFMVKLRMRNLNRINNQQIKYRQGKVEELFQQLDNINKNEYFENYIIQTSIAPNELPSQINLINNIKQSIQLCKEKPKQQGQSNDELLQVNFHKFQSRYAYCPSVKQIFKPQANLTTQNKFEDYFKKNKENGMIKNGEKVCINIPFYDKLQKQRDEVQIKMNKIKKMMKTIKFRVSILSNLSLNSKKIRLITLLCKRMYPQMQDAFKQLKQQTSCYKIQEHLNKRCFKIEKVCLKDIKKRAGIEMINKILSQKQTQRDKMILFMKKIKKIMKKQRCKQLGDKLQKFMKKKILQNKKQAFRKLNQQYNIVVNPPPVPSHQTHKIQSNKQQQNALNINPVSANQTPKKIQTEPSQIKSNNGNTMNISPSTLPKIPQENKMGSKMEENSNSPEENQLVDQQSNQNENSQSNYSQYGGQSTNRGIEKSQTSRKITQPQLFSLNDRPKFTFQIWCKQAVGFQNRKPIEPQQNPTTKILFNKPQGTKQIHKQADQQLNVDILIKQKIVVNPFFPYLMAHIEAKTQDQIQTLMSHQQNLIKAPLLKDYPRTKYPKTAMQIFNNLLKIGLDKNTSKPTSQLINMIVKPIRDTYNSEKSNISTVFDGQPAIIVDYTWDHNLIKDEIFMQFIKQIMMNHNEQSLQSLSSALEVITRYYYPSPKFIYCFLHFLKSLQSKNIQKLNTCFLNTLLFAQAFQRYKGNNVTVIKDQIGPKQKESYPQLEPRFTLITEKQLQNCLKIELRLINQQIFQFKVRNQTLSHYKRKILKNINMLHYEQYFGVYYCYQGKSTQVLMKQQKKAIDFLNQYPQKPTEHLLYIKLKCYFPFNIKQINKTRIMYLNSIIDERILPWSGKEYEKCVVLSMMFDQFQEYRISNYMIITNQIQSNIDLSSIQQKYTDMANQRGKKICQIQYFKLLKQNSFLAAKAYRVKEQNPQSNLYKITTILIKPLQLCFYCATDQKSSVDLHRIKGYAMQKSEIYLQLDFVDEEGHLGMRTLTIKNIDRIHQFYMDLAAYISYINQ